MGYRGKLELRQRARQLRADGWTMPDIAAELSVSRSSVSLWTRDVEFVAGPRRRARRQKPGKLELIKQAEIEAMLEQGRAWIGALSDREFLVAGAALYAGEGTKRDGSVRFSNSDMRMMALFSRWLRHFFDVDESRLRVRLYLHEGLDLEEAERCWSGVTGVPRAQFRQPYRAEPDASIRTTKHIYGCACLIYDCSRTHRAVMGLVAALLSSSGLPG